MVVEVISGFFWVTADRHRLDGRLQLLESYVPIHHRRNVDVAKEGKRPLKDDLV